AIGGLEEALRVRPGAELRVVAIDDAMVRVLRGTRRAEAADPGLLLREQRRRQRGGRSGGNGAGDAGTSMQHESPLATAHSRPRRPAAGCTLRRKSLPAPDMYHIGVCEASCWSYPQPR